MADQNKLSEALRRIVQAPENNLMILHGFVAKYTPGDNGVIGTIDFISMDGTVRIPEIPLSAIPGLSKGQMTIPTIKSDVTVLWAVGTGNASILSFSHIDTYNIISTKEVNIGVTSETPNDEVDYNELEDDGNKSGTTYTNSSITSMVSNKTDSATKMSSEIGSSKVEIEKEQIKDSVGDSYEKLDTSGITLEGKQIFVGEGATEPAVLGTQLVTLMMKFITECSKITTPTMLGTMPIINLANFTSFLSECNSFLSQTVKVK
jgi:hypothetical protein